MHHKRQQGERGLKTTYKIMKLRARQSLQGHYGVVVGSQILMGVLMAAFMFVFEIAMVIVLFSGVLWLDGKSPILYIVRRVHADVSGNCPGKANGCWRYILCL